MPDAVRTTTSQPGAAARRRGSAVEAVEPGHREVEQDEVGREPARRLDRLRAVGGLADDVEAVLLEQRGERLAGERVVVDDEDARTGFHGGLIGTGAPCR